MTSMHMPKAPMGTFTSELPSMSHRLGLKDSMLGSSGHFKYPYGSHDDDHGSNDQPSQSIDYNSERFFDDVFLQISPDYGCLV
jgi:hypothetical protein